MTGWDRKGIYYVAGHSAFHKGLLTVYNMPGITPSVTRDSCLQKAYSLEVLTG